MNRDGLNKLKKIVQAYDYSIRRADSLFQKSIEEMRDDEETKQENLPESLQSSKMAESIEEATTMLESLLENAMNIIDELDEILSISGVSSCFMAPQAETLLSTPSDRKNVRFQALFSSSLFSKLRQESALRGLSMNEIVIRALMKELPI